MTTIIGVRFQRAGKIYTFSPGGETFSRGDGVIVETARGVEFGTVAEENREVDDALVNQPLKEVIRKATEQDYASRERNRARVPEAMRIAREKIRAHNLDMKLVDCEFTFDGSKVIFYFTSEDRVDFRELVRDLASVFRIRIELRQIGIRDEAKMRGGLAPCGLPCCCSYHLPDFKRVSIKMAKNQGLSLNPGKISGLCGRLMCCLEYENPYYAEICKVVPKIGSEVLTADRGKGTVVSNHLLKLMTRVKFAKEDGSFEFQDYPVQELRYGAHGGAGKRDAEEEDGEEDAEFTEEQMPSAQPADGERREKSREGSGRSRNGDRGDRADRRPQNGAPRKNGSDHREQGGKPENRERRDRKPFRGAGAEAGQPGQRRERDGSGKPPWKEKGEGARPRKDGKPFREEPGKEPRNGSAEQPKTAENTKVEPENL